jgi:uncharacterized damage-inducible protein DinB
MEAKMITLRCFSIACCLLLSAQWIAAQTAGGSTDRLSGTWTGYMRPNGVPDSAQQPITVELKLGGASAVTGTVTGPPTPGLIKSGTFDPSTGALKFAVTVPGETAPFVFEGTVVHGSATGRVTAGTDAGVFILTKAGGSSAAARPAGDTTTAAALRFGLGEVTGWVTKSAELVPADKYSYRPTQSVRTFGQQIAHLADSYNYYCARAAGRTVQWSDAIEKGSTDKATLLPKLKQSVDACTAAYAGTPDVRPALANIAHTNLHYGNIITYLRMLGLTPPSS